jgi:hypothetical protein
MINRIAGIPTESPQRTTSTAEASSLFERVNLEEMIQPVEQAIVKNPGVAVAVAFAVGVTLACLIKRR